ncbi:hypothetical protein BO79DRAFT_17423 [Aspergillus costaricaensis CBS 115574]|uniref:Uncharacterized protein n=1 Tax=Aspergillus costaricaensis CBS 115574 TaxID=1448317 RepID=A0ACD1IE26_9EURO|nr:hypothetical protein BO79DRAFT_17423 [Aspergillus costaricaensis CBS 115574]RAK88671.1 hypothetical protein BO79DRAFT_17423 [Aspergillus costaricaensis CBS 115574]
MYYGLSSAARSFLFRLYLCPFIRWARCTSTRILCHLFSFFLYCSLVRSFRCCCGSSHAYDGALSAVQSRATRDLVLHGHCYFARDSDQFSLAFGMIDDCGMARAHRCLHRLATFVVQGALDRSIV